MTVCIIKYNAGNCASVANCLARIGCPTVVSDEPAVIKAASHVIFPGVGEAASAMAYLRSRGLDELIRKLNQPFLGICLGLQLLCRQSEERDTPCLGIFAHKVRRFAGAASSTAGGAIKVPHMGWNTVVPMTTASHWPNVGAGAEHYYFLHSYYAEVGPQTVALCTHGQVFSAALRQDNFSAVQFHPEKSGVAGERLLREFVTS